MGCYDFRRWCKESIRNCLLTAFGLALALVLYQYAFLSPQTGEQAEKLLLSIPQIIAGIIALIFSLSIIPLQRASETSTPSIRVLYLHDPKVLTIFFLLVLLCVASFLICLDTGSPSFRIKFPLGLIFVLGSFDLLRWHHRRVGALLEPAYAISVLWNHCAKNLARVSNQVDKLAARFRRSNPDATPEQIRATLSHAITSSSINRTIVAWNDEIMESVTKAFRRYEPGTVRHGISTMSQLAVTYIRLRKDSAVVTPQFFGAGFVFRSDIELVLNPVYQSFEALGRIFIQGGDQAACIPLVAGLQSISAELTSFEAGEDPGIHTGTLTYMPVGYLGNLVKDAQRAGLQDVPLTGSAALREIGIAAPRQISAANLHLNLIKLFSDTAHQFLGSKRPDLGNQVVNDLMLVLASIVTNRHHEQSLILQEGLRSVKSFISIYISLENAGLITERLSDAAPYALTNEVNLVELLQSHQAIKEEHDRYQQLAALLEPVRRHLYDLCRETDFRRTFILWQVLYLIQTLQDFLTVTLSRVTDAQSRSTLEKEFRWICALPAWCFARKRGIHREWAAFGADVCATRAIEIAATNRDELVAELVDQIRSIAEAVFEDSEGRPNPYDIADILTKIHPVSLLLKELGSIELHKKCEELLNRPFENTDPETSSGIQGAIAVREKQFFSDLQNVRPQAFDQSVGRLRRKLRELKASENEDDTCGEPDHGTVE